jgi:lipopolysaccharide heptosyltransferase I
MRILVVRLGSLGDLVHALPAVAAIRRASPDAEIDWLVDEVHLDFLALVPILSEIVVLRGRTARAWLDVRTRLRARHYDVAVDFQGLLKSAALARLSGASRVIGFDRSALREPAAVPFYTEQVKVGEGRHVIEKNLRLAAVLGAEAGPLEFPIRDVRSAIVDSIVAADPRPFAILNTGAAWPNKRWPADRLGRIAAWLRDRHELRSVALWGPDEAPFAQQVVAASDGAAIAAPATSLPDLVALSRAAKLMVSGDTGPTHIAAAVGTPVVALFGPTNPARNGPWDEDDVVVSRYEACGCHYERKCSRDAAHWCLSTITERDARQAIDSRLQRAAERSSTAGRSTS